MTFESLPVVIAPVVIAIVAVAVRAAVAWQRELTWREYVFWHGLRRRLFPPIEWAADKWDRIPDPPLVSTKGGRDDAEFLMNSDLEIKEIVERLQEEGHELHLINALKRRKAVYTDSKYEYTVAHTRFVHDTDDDEPDRQTEVYIFGNGDIYAHNEIEVEDPDGHLDIGEQVDGDPAGVVPKSLF